MVQDNTPNYEYSGNTVKLFPLQIRSDFLKYGIRVNWKYLPGASIKLVIWLSLKALKSVMTKLNRGHIAKVRKDLKKLCLKIQKLNQKGEVFRLKETLRKSTEQSFIPKNLEPVVSREQIEIIGPNLDEGFRKSYWGLLKNNNKLEEVLLKESMGHEGANERIAASLGMRLNLNVNQVQILEKANGKIDTIHYKIGTENNPGIQYTILHKDMKKRVNKADLDKQILFKKYIGDYDSDINFRGENTLVTKSEIDSKTGKILKFDGFIIDNGNAFGELLSPVFSKKLDPKIEARKFRAYLERLDEPELENVKETLLMISRLKNSEIQKDFNEVAKYIPEKYHDNYVPVLIAKRENVIKFLEEKLNYEINHRIIPISGTNSLSA